MSFPPSGRENVDPKLQLQNEELATFAKKKIFFLLKII